MVATHALEGWAVSSAWFLFLSWLPLQLLLVTGANRALGISDHYFALGDSLVLTVLGQVRLQHRFYTQTQILNPHVT